MTNYPLAATSPGAVEIAELKVVTPYFHPQFNFKIFLEVKLPYPVKKLFRSRTFIEEEAKRMQIEATKVLQNQDKMKECCDDIEHALSGIYPKSKAYVFGSRISGLGKNVRNFNCIIFYLIRF